MKERPILFSGAMVQAILAGSKTQTRRVVTPQPFHGEWFDGHLFDEETFIPCPHGTTGDGLWVRETWCKAEGGGFAFAADSWTAAPSDDGHWRPSIFMPRQACRVMLEITAIRAENLQDISEADANAEGIEFCIAAGEVASAREVYRVLWDSLNAKRGYSWSKNPWVWVIEFRRVAP